jgi:hypothetical protein
MTWLEDGDKFGIALVLIIISFVGGCLVGAREKNDQWESECVRRELGHFNEERKFVWTGEEE